MWVKASCKNPAAISTPRAMTTGPGLTAPAAVRAPAARCNGTAMTEQDDLQDCQLRNVPNKIPGARPPRPQANHLLLLWCTSSPMPLQGFTGSDRMPSASYRCQPGWLPL